MFSNFQELIFEGVKAYLEHRHLLSVDHIHLTINDNLCLFVHRNKEDIMYIDVYVKDILCSTISELGHQTTTHYIINEKACKDLYDWSLDMYNKYHYDSAAAQARVNSY